MNVALSLKELRETAGIAALGFVGFGLFLLNAVGWLSLSTLGIPTGPAAIPFLQDPFPGNFAVCAVVLAIALGLRQSLGDLFGDAQLFLLHRPISRRTFVVSKLVVGFSLYLALSLFPAALYALWAASSGSHPSPFEWSMTTSVWLIWLAIGNVYLGAFLAGIRPGSWRGTRLLPLAAAGGVALIASNSAPFASLTMTLAAGMLLIGVILFVVETRDFA